MNLNENLGISPETIKEKAFQAAENTKEANADSVKKDICLFKENINYIINADKLLSKEFGA